MLWLEYLETRGRDALVGALVLLTLAAIGRPEMPLLVPLWALATTLAAVTSHPPLRDRAALVGVALSALLVVPHALRVRAATQQLSEAGNLPSLSHLSVADLVRGLVSYDTLLWPSLFPVTLLGFALGAFVVREAAQLRGRLALLLVAISSLALYSVDLCRANMARVHVPGALLVTVLAAAGLSLLWGRFRGRLARALLGAAVIGAAVPGAVCLWAPTNEQAEEELLQDVLQRLPLRDPFTLVRIAREDRVGSAITHFHFPDYLIHPAGPKAAGE